MTEQINVYEIYDKTKQFDPSNSFVAVKDYVALQQQNTALKDALREAVELTKELVGGAMIAEKYYRAFIKKSEDLLSSQPK